MSMPRIAWEMLDAVGGDVGEEKNVGSRSVACWAEPMLYCML